MQISAIEKEEGRNQHWMSGFLKSPNTDISCLSVKPHDPPRSSSVNPIIRGHFRGTQETINEEADVDEMLQRIEALAKENKALKVANR